MRAASLENIPLNFTLYSFYSGLRRRMVAPGSVFQHGSVLYSWVKNLCPWGYLWWICEEIRGEGSGKDCWRPIWPQERVGASGKPLTVSQIKVWKYFRQDNVYFVLFMLPPPPSPHPPWRLGHCFWCRSRRRRCLYLHYLLKERMDFDFTCTDALLEKGKRLVRFLCPWLYSHGQRRPKDMWKWLVCILSPERVDRFEQNLHRYIIGRCKRIG